MHVCVFAWSEFRIRRPESDDVDLLFRWVEEVQLRPAPRPDLMGLLLRAARILSRKPSNRQRAIDRHMHILAMVLTAQMASPAGVDLSVECTNGFPEQLLPETIPSDVEHVL